MRAEPWLGEIRAWHQPAISFGCDYCATTRRKADIALGTLLTKSTSVGMSAARMNLDISTGMFVRPFAHA